MSTASSHTAVLLDRQLTLTVGDTETPVPVVGEVRVAVAWAGVCGSDLHVMRSGDWVREWPAILGHEVVGLVEECPGGELDPGTAVVLDSRVPCGECAGCRRSGHLCERLEWLGECRPGGFEEFTVVPVTDVVPVPAGLDIGLAVLAEPLAVALHAVRRASLLGPIDRCLVLGGGPIGQLVAATLVSRGVSVHVVEPDPGRRGLAESLIGVGTTSAPGKTPAGSASWPVVIDASGHPDALRQCVERVQRGGVVALVALSETIAAVRTAGIVEKEVGIVGCNGFEDDDLPGALDLLAHAPHRFRPLITEAIDLAALPERIDRWAEHPPTGKLVVHP